MDGAASLEIKNGTTTVSAEDETLDVSACKEIKGQATYALEVGTEYSLSVSEAEMEKLVLVFGEHGAEQDDQPREAADGPEASGRKWRGGGRRVL